MSGRFVVIVVDGSAADIADVYTDSIRYEGLSWEDSVTLAKLSFSQGFEIVIWRLETEAEEGDGGEQEKPAVH